MIHITTHSETGQIMQTMTLLDETEADQNGIWIEGHWNGNEYYILNGEATDRPDLGLPTTHTLSVNTEWNLGSILEGTDVLIDGVVVGTTDDTKLSLSFPLVREYTVEFRPPFPYKNHQIKVTVDETNT